MSLIDEIIVAWAKTEDLELAIQHTAASLRRRGLNLDLDTEFAEACRVIRSQRKGIEPLISVTCAQARRDWYSTSNNRERHWPAVRSKLSRQQGWTPQAITSLDNASTEIVSLLGNPYAEEFSCRGLVLGHVQSGKTANMTAVIAKAVDTKYNLVMVLTGMTNKLRFQTQARLMEDLVSRFPAQWHVLTPNTPDGDFRATGRVFQGRTDTLRLAAVKKNASPLRNLLKELRDTPRTIRDRLRVLVIDDECDQASVNTKRNVLDMTAINGLIRELLAELPAVSYVGYTATPFANVLISPYAKSGAGLDDLYPRDFITALPTPKEYFGAKKLFGLPPLDASKPTTTEEGLDMIRLIPNDDVSFLQPVKRKDVDDFYPEMCDSLQDALLYFFACCAARRARGHHSDHMTMLVHTSAYVVMHNRLASLIEQWTASNRAFILRHDSVLGRRLKKIWNKERKTHSSAPPRGTTEDLNKVFEHLEHVLDTVEFPVENGRSDDRIDYGKGMPKTYVVVGGTILSRGLTLQGLMVSYFLRGASQYDTLLQMGRWFGYRTGYADLPRIWTTSDLALSFRDLAAIEQEVREEIDQFRHQKKTPLDLAVRIRAIPGMAITAANKMRAAQTCSVTYWGVHRQTCRFQHSDATWLKANWDAASTLVDSCERLNLRAGHMGRLLWRDVPKDTLLQFFNLYRIHATHTDLQASLLKPFLELSDPRLDSWNVGVSQPLASPKSKHPLGMVGRVRLTSRARLPSTESFADIKALMSLRDIGFDCDLDFTGPPSWRRIIRQREKRIGPRPLLLLYAINASSQPQQANSATRIALNAVRDVLAVGIVFPGSNSDQETHVSVVLRPNWIENPDEVVQQESQQVEFADGL